MSIQILPEQPSFASALGTGLGKGLSNQLPQEIERYRLGAGIRNFENNLQGKSLFERYGALASIPGMTPGLFSALAPFIQSSGQEQALKINAGKGNENIQQNVVTPQNENISENNMPIFQQNERGQPAKNLATEYFRPEYRSLNPTYESAQRASANDINTLKKEAEEVRNAYFQKDKQLAETEVGGEYLQRLLQKYENKLRPGANIQQLANDYAKEAIDFAREKAGNRHIFDSWSIFHPPTEKQIKDLRRNIKNYTKRGVPIREGIDDIVDTQDVGRGFASYIADDLRDSAAAKPIYSLPNADLTQPTGKRNAALDNAAREAAANLKPTDLIGSLSYIADAKGYDSQLLQDKISDYADENNIPLTADQRSDLNRRMTPAPKSLAEVWIEATTGIPVNFAKNYRHKILETTSGEREKARNGR